MIETKITSKLAKAIRDTHGAHSVLNIHGHTMQAPGWPDWFLSTFDTSAWIELKGQSTTLTLAQRKVLIHLNACGQHAYVLRLLSRHVFMWEDYNGKSLLSCGGASWKDAANSVVCTLKDISSGTGTDT